MHKYAVLLASPPSAKGPGEYAFGYVHARTVAEAKKSVLWSGCPSGSKVLTAWGSKTLLDTVRRGHGAELDEERPKIFTVPGPFGPEPTFSPETTRRIAAKAAKHIANIIAVACHRANLDSPIYVSEARIAKLIVDEFPGPVSATMPELESEADLTG